MSVPYFPYSMKYESLKNRNAYQGCTNSAVSYNDAFDTLCHPDLMKSENINRNPVYRPIVEGLRVIWSCFAFFGRKEGKRNFLETSNLSFAVSECHCCNSLLTSHMFLINIPNCSRVERKCTVAHTLIPYVRM